MDKSDLQTDNNIDKNILTEGQGISSNEKPFCPTEEKVFEVNKPLLIDEDIRLKILGFLRDKFSGGKDGKCFFRRIETVIPKSEPVQIVKFSSPDTFEHLKSIKNLTFQEIDRYVEITYRSFICITNPRPVRYEQDPDELEDKEVFLHSNNYNQLDMSYDYTFDFPNGRENNSAKDKLGFPVTPCVGDLAFIYISNSELSKFCSLKDGGEAELNHDKPKQEKSDKLVKETPKTKNDVGKKKKIFPKATYWCVASDQFLRAWTAIMFDWHETFDKLVGNAMNIQTIKIVDSKEAGTFNESEIFARKFIGENNFVADGTSSKESCVNEVVTVVKNKNTVLREKLFVGNKLMTNSWLKRKLALKFNNLDFPENEKKERFWYMRSEYISKRWVDTYCALVLIARYGELPCPVNVPNNNDNEPKRHFWHLPEEFISMIFSRSLGGKNVTQDLIINHDLWMKNTRAKQNLLSKPFKGKVKLGFLDEIAKCRIDGNPRKTFSNVVRSEKEIFVDKSSQDQNKFFDNEVRKTNKKVKLKKGSPKIVNEHDFPVTDMSQPNSENLIQFSSDCARTNPFEFFELEFAKKPFIKPEFNKTWVQVVKKNNPSPTETGSDYIGTNLPFPTVKESSIKDENTEIISVKAISLDTKLDKSTLFEEKFSPKLNQTTEIPFDTQKYGDLTKVQLSQENLTTKKSRKKAAQTKSKNITQEVAHASEYPRMGPKISSGSSGYAIIKSDKVNVENSVSTKYIEQISIPISILTREQKVSDCVEDIKINTNEVIRDETILPSDQEVLISNRETDNLARIQIKEIILSQTKVDLSPDSVLRDNTINESKNSFVYDETGSGPKPRTSFDTTGSGRTRTTSIKLELTIDIPKDRSWSQQILENNDDNW
jgi:hypothetical protein